MYASEGSSDQEGSGSFYSFVLWYNKFPQRKFALAHD